MKKIEVSIDPLRRILEALNGPAHLIRELQVTRGPLVGDDNPINLLVDEFNQEIKLINESYKEQENDKEK